jgi:hypothetical protein
LLSTYELLYSTGTNAKKFPLVAAYLDTSLSFVLAFLHLIAVDPDIAEASLFVTGEMEG